MRINRRDRRPLLVGRDESRDFFSQPLAQATPLKPVAAEKPRAKNAQHEASAVSQKSQSFRLLLLRLGFAKRATASRSH